MITKVFCCKVEESFRVLISPCQSSFVTGIQLLDGVLVANEILDQVTTKNIECLMFKVDFEKAYDKVSWDFLRFMMKRMRFGRRWMRWMEACIFNNHMLILVNCSPNIDFKVGKGVRQEYPISSLIFVIIVEGLKSLVRKALERGEVSKGSM